MTLNILHHRRIWYAISVVLLVPGLVFLAMGGLKFGIDFTGGSLIQFAFADSERPETAEMQETIAGTEVGTAQVQLIEDDGMLIRLKELTPEEHATVLEAVTAAYPGASEVSYSAVGPTIGQELRSRAVTALVLVLLGIVAYISWAFRASSGRLSGWAFGVNAIIALLHDVGILLGVFAMLGYFASVEIDILFVTAVLTVLGFSVHDTIVVFDRIREGLRRGSGASIETVINTSVNETFVRSINTSVTVLLVLIALYFFGGSSIQYFVLALMIGMLVGTYSSIFIASPLLLFWVKRKQ